MNNKNLIIILFIFLFFLSGLFIFFQQSDSTFFKEIKSFKSGSDEFRQIYVLEIPPKSKYLAEAGSEKFYNTLWPEDDIITQNPENILPGLLKLFDVEYVLLQDKKYWEFFEPFFDYYPGEEKEDLPRTFPIKKEAISFFNEPFLILGEGWHAPGKDVYGVAERGFGKEATIRYVIPPGALGRAPELLSFSTVWSSLSEKGRRAEIEVIVNGKLIHSSDFYNWAVLRLDGLHEGINEIKFRSPKGCVVSGKDDRCFSFIIQKVELIDWGDVPPEGLFKLDRFIETKEGYWVGKNASLYVFTFSPRPVFIDFQIRPADGKVRMVSIIENDKEIKRIILFGEEFQEIRLLTYQQGRNLFYFSADNCENKTIEGKEKCVAAQIKDLKIAFPE